MEENNIENKINANKPVPDIPNVPDHVYESSEYHDGDAAFEIKDRTYLIVAGCIIAALLFVYIYIQIKVKLFEDSIQDKANDAIELAQKEAAKAMEDVTDEYAMAEEAVAENAEDAEEAYTETETMVVVKGQHVRLRRGPSTDYDIITNSYGYPLYPPKGAKLKYLGEDGDFYYVEYKGEEGYISKDFCYLE